MVASGILATVIVEPRLWVDSDVANYNLSLNFTVLAVVSVGANIVELIAEI